MKKRKQIIYFGLICIAINTHAQSFRKYSNEFLKIGVGGKYLGMGGALVSSKDDVTSTYYNPAGLAELRHLNIGVMHTEYYAGIAKFDYAGIAAPLKGDQTIGLSFVRFAIDDIPNTIDLYNPDGTINYDKIKSFSIADMAFFITYARKINAIEGLSVGGNMKVIYRKYGSFANAMGFGVDLSAQIVREKWQVGLFLQDITTTFNSWKFSFSDAEKQVFRSTNNDIPNSTTELTAPSIHFGGQYRFSFLKDHLSIAPAVKFSAYTDHRNVLISASPMSLYMALGANIGFWDIAYLRLGISNFTRATNDFGEQYLSVTPSMGLGIHFSNFQINYSYNNIANTGIGLYSHVFSLSYEGKKK